MLLWATGFDMWLIVVILIDEHQPSICWFIEKVMLTVQDSTLDFPIWLLFQLGFLDALVMIVELKLTGYLSEPGVCVSTVWAQNGKKRLLYCKLCLPCPQICSLFLGILCNDQQQSDEQLPRWSQCFRTSLYIIQIRHNASHERIAG